MSQIWEETNLLVSAQKCSYLKIVLLVNWKVLEILSSHESIFWVRSTNEDSTSWTVFASEIVVVLVINTDVSQNLAVVIGETIKHQI